MANPRATIFGWAGDLQAKAPARKVIATVGGKIVARSTPRIERGDLLLIGLPAAYARSGFRLQIPAALQDSKELHVLAVARDGSIAELPSGSSPPPHGFVHLGRRTIRLNPTPVSGHVDGTLAAPSMQFELPPHSHWADYRWLEINAGKNGFRQGAFEIFDRQGGAAPGSRLISFETLASFPRRYVVPVSSCPQWHGYRARRLFLEVPAGQDISAVRLIR